MPPTAPPTADPVIPLRLAAERVGMSTDTLRRRADEGALTILRLGPRLLGVRASELDRWLDACRVASRDGVRHER